MTKTRLIKKKDVTVDFVHGCEYNKWNSIHRNTDIMNSICIGLFSTVLHTRSINQHFVPASSAFTVSNSEGRTGTNRLVIDLVNDRVTNVIKPSLNLLFTVTHCLKKVYILVLIEPKPLRAAENGPRWSSW